MPMDNGFDFDEYWRDHQTMYLNQCKWRVTRPLWPRFDALSKKLLWVKPAMRGERHVPGLTWPEIYWVDKDEYLIWKLKGNK